MRRLYTPSGPERCGFILHDGSVVEVVNSAIEPNESFNISADIILTYEQNIAVAWHTHPGGSSNLSSDDLQSMVSFPDWKHLIIGSDGLACYSVTSSGVVIRDVEENYPTWAVETVVP